MAYANDWSGQASATLPCAPAAALALRRAGANMPTGLPALEHGQAGRSVIGRHVTLPFDDRNAIAVTSGQHIAILDDEVEITTLLANYMQGSGYRVTQVHSGRALMQVMKNDAPALVLLDLGLPGEDGFAIARQLREHWNCGLVIVTGRGDAVDKVVGLEVGADDYVTKPFDLRELLARCKAVLRRLDASESTTPASNKAKAEATRLCFDVWQLDVGARRLVGPSGEVELTAGEFDLLLAFLRSPGKVLSRDALLEQTRGREAGPFDRTIDVQVGRLRKKLESDPEKPQIIKSVRGAGYILVPAVSSN
jgi:two-component system OmpR family response regulator